MYTITIIKWGCVYVCLPVPHHSRTTRPIVNQSRIIVKSADNY